MTRAQQYEALWAQAHAAGMAAGQAVVPEPMYVVQRANPFDDRSEVVTRYPPVMDGVCGFAGVTIRPGTGSLARWASKTGRARRAYYGGVETSVAEFNQSLTRKEAYAHAFARVLQAAGIGATVWSRMD